MLLLPARMRAQNLLSNGDFEQFDRHTYSTYFAPGDYAYVKAPDTVPGWTFSDSVDLYGAANSPQHGAQFLDLVGGGALATTFSIQQSFGTVIGNTYHLDFFYGNNETVATGTFTASVIGTGTLWTANFTHSGDTMTVRNWTEFSVDFVANSTNTTIMFVDTTHAPSGFDPNYTIGGATLDNIIITPEPGGFTTVLCILGAVLAAILTERRRRERRFCAR
jgi:hypothetical protein